MAGTLVISTLSDGTNSTSSTNCIQGSAKAWVSFNGSTATIIRAYNVSSITKNSTGRWTVNFTSALPNATYTTLVNGNIGTTVQNDTWAGSLTTTGFAMGTNYNGGAYDSGYETAAVFS